MADKHILLPLICMKVLQLQYIHARSNCIFFDTQLLEICNSSKLDIFAR